MARFSLIIQGYDFDIMHTKGLLNSAADALSRRPYDITDTEAVDTLTYYLTVNQKVKLLIRPNCDD